MSAGDSPFLQVLLWLQESALSGWVTESPWTMFFFLTVHTITMGLLAGTGMAIGMRVLGFAPGVPLSRMSRFLPVMLASLPVAIVSGVFLVIGYPAKALTNPVFYLKLALVAAALALTRWLVLGTMRPASFDEVGAPLPARIAAVRMKNPRKKDGRKI